MADWLRYANQGATRNRPINDQMLNALGFLPKMGVTMEVFSGGQPTAAEGGGRTGSVRHDHGNAADVFFSQNGRRLDWSNPKDLPLFQDIVRQAKAAGLTGFGAGPGYMQPGSMHIGYGKPGVWGAGGSGRSAPSWLVDAYGGVPASKPMPSYDSMMTAQAPSAPQAGSIASLYAGAPTAAPGGVPAPAGVAAMFDPNAVQASPDLAIGNLASLFVQDQQARRQQREDEQAAEQTRRAALFGAPVFG